MMAITNEADYEQAVERIGEIIDAEPCTPEYNELIRLIEQTVAYEDLHWPIGGEE